MNRWKTEDFWGARKLFDNIIKGTYNYGVVQSLSHVCFFVTLRTAAFQAPLSFTISWSLLRFTSFELVMLSNHLNLCCPLLLPSVFPSIKVFCNESVLRIRWPKYQSFSISPSNEYSGLISVRIDWSPCSPRDSQASSPPPQFEGINSSVLCLLHGPTLTSVLEKTYFGYMGLCQQSDVSAF